MKNLFAFLILLFCVNAATLAQRRGYDWGYIITEKGDTLEGWINDRSTRSFSELNNRILYKQEGKVFKKRYSSNDILGYGYLGVHFVSIPLLERTQFFKTSYVIRPGANRRFLRVVERNDCLNHYEIEFMHDDNFMIDSYPLFHIPGTREMVRVTQGILGLKKKRLAEYFVACHDLVIAIDSEQLTTLQEVYRFYCERCND